MAITKLPLHMGEAGEFFDLCSEQSQSSFPVFMSYGNLNTEVDIKEEVDLRYTF